MRPEKRSPTIAKLVADLNFPISIDDMKTKTLSEKVSAVYNNVKEKGEIEIFWKFAVGSMTEFEYIISQNPESRKRLSGFGFSL